MRLPYALAIIMAVCFLSTGCGGGYREPLYTQDQEPPGTGEAINGSRAGTWTQTAGSGQVVWRGTYAAGRRQGTWKEWDESGQLLIECSYDQNRRQGDVKLYHRGKWAGKLERIEAYDHGIRHGEWRYFDQNTGKTVKIERFSKGQRHGAQLTVFKDGVMREVYFDNDAAVLERHQRGSELSVYQLDPQGRHHGLWVTVLGDAIASVVRMEHGGVSEDLFEYTPRGTAPEKRKTPANCDWTWTAYGSPQCKYSGGINQQTQEASIYRYDLHQVWTPMERWTLQNRKVIKQEKREMGPNSKGFVWLPVEPLVAPPSVAWDAVVENPPSKALRSINLPLDPIQEITP